MRLAFAGLTAGLSFLGIVGAFGVSPTTRIEDVDQRIVVQPVEIAHSLQIESETSQMLFWREEPIQRGDSLVSIFSRLKVDDPDATRFLQTAIRIGSLPNPSLGKTVAVQSDSSGSVSEFRYRVGSKVHTVRRVGGEFRSTTGEAPTERRIVMRSGTILSSLFAATDSVGIPDSVASGFAELFSGEIDLHRDIRRGDRFGIVFEMNYVDGELTGPGRILAAEFTNQGKRHQAIYFEDERIEGDYYTPSGKSMRGAFLRTPLEFSRVTSGFSSNRFHPVLQVWRAHKGTDFGAPAGTPVRSTGAGVVIFVGWQNGYGKVVEIRHGGSVTTKYGHLSAFATELRLGTRVAQGQVIGFVGMTGLASGPHLHYEFHLNGVQSDPQSVSLLQRPALPASAHEAFLRKAADRLAQVALIRETDVAARE